MSVVLSQRTGRVLTVTVNRPERLNALNAEVVEALRETFHQAKSDPEVGALVVTGAGEKAFVAGADIGGFRGLSPVAARDLARRGQTVLDLLETLGKPSIAAVNGFALGGGCELAMACDIRIASENAKFGQPEVNLGLIPGYGGSQRTTRLLGKGMALYLCLTGEIVDAREALRIGLVDRVVPLAELMEEAHRIAGAIATKAPLAVAACKRAIYRGAHLALADALEVEAMEFGLLVDSKDFREGTSAFLEKRKPAWTGK